MTSSNYGVTEADVRAVGGLDETAIITSTVTTIIPIACKILNGHINYYIEDEPMEQTDDTTKFFVKHWPIGDMNGDIDVITSSIVICDDIREELDRVTQTVTAINAKTGMVTIATAQTGTLYATYVHVGKDVTGPDNDVYLAALYTAIAMCWDNIHQSATSTRIADISVTQKNAYWAKAERHIANINTGLKLDATRKNRLKAISKLPW